MKDLIQKSNMYYEKLLGYFPIKTKLQTLNISGWKSFCRKTGLNENSSGVFLPRNQTAIVLQDCDDAPLSLFHEYFGHGLFSEQNQIGQKLVNFEKKLMQEEKVYFNGRYFTSDELQEFRSTNHTFKKLQQERNENIKLYEAFAIWTEYLLSGLFELRKTFEIKYENISEEEEGLINKINSFQQRFGILATFYAIGFAKYYDTQKIKSLLEDIYGKDRISSAKLILLYGSKKPHSDIDVFIVSDMLSKVKTSWIDVNVICPKEFEEKIKLFDIEVSDPLLTGELVSGNRKWFENQRNRLESQPITEESIRYNFNESQEQKRLALHYPEGSHESSIGLSYSHTFFENSRALQRGERKLTKGILISDSINLKGEKDENAVFTINL